MMKIRILIGILLCMPTMLVYGQEGNEETSYKLAQFPPSPEASAMARFDEYPVNKSTGLPDISIPLFEINEGGIHLPINIRYHAGGIKVQDDPSIVGLGWSLSYGGNISRSVRGLPDENPFGFLKSAMQIPSYNSIQYGLVNLDLLNQTHSQLKQVTQQKKGFEPDLFSYSFGQKSGSFMFGNDMQIYTIPYDGTLIEPLFSNEGGGRKLKGFVTMDDLGVHYTFGNILDNDGFIEITNIDNWGDPPPLPHASAWLLKNIYNPFTQAEIYFEYIDNPIGPLELPTESRYYTLQTGGWDNGVPGGDFIVTNHASRTIKKILLNNRTIEFNYSNYTYNNVARKKLDRIIYKENISGGLEQYADFEYSTYNDGRLKLDKVTIGSNQDTQVKEYVLEYDGSPLPAYDSKSMDHWGYYNGASNNSLLPNVPFGNNVNLGNGADRAPNPDKTGVGSLKKITYPTGGYTKYTFEQNSFERQKTIEDIQMTEASIEITANLSNPTSQINLNQAFQELIDNNHILPGSFKITGLLNLHWECGGNPPPPEPEQGTISLIRNQVPYNTIELYRLTNGDCILEGEEIVMLDFNTNEYVLKAELTNPLSSNSIIASFIYYYYDPQELDQIIIDYGGGQRIQKIENYDNVTGEVNTRTYTYDGYLTSRSKPKYHSLSWSKGGQGQGYGCENPKTHVTISSSASSGLGSSANSVAYSKVTEIFGTQNENTGRIETYFKKASDDHTGHGAPFFARNSYQWIRSLPLKEVVLANTGNTANDSVKITEYLYEPIPDLNFKIRAFKASRRFQYTCTSLSYDDMRNEFIYDNYDYSIENLRAKNIITSDFFYNNNEEQQVISNKQFVYDNPLSQKPTSIVTTNSQDQEVRIDEFYPSSSIIDDCYEPCMVNFQADLYNCGLLDHQAFLELSQCNTIWGQGNDAIMNCYDIAANYFCIPIPLPPYIHCAYTKPSKDYFDCKKNARNYFYGENGLYTNCLEGLDFDGMACYNEVIANYITCKEGINLCIYEKMDNASNEIDKAKYLLALFDIKSLLLEKKITVDGQETDHHKWNYKLFSANDLDDVPLLHSIDKYINGTLNVREVEVTAYNERNRISELRYKDNEPYSSFQWGASYTNPTVGVENAQRNEIYHEGFEEHPNGVVFNSGGANHSKTGKKALANGYFTIPHSFQPPAGAILSYWYYDGSEGWKYHEGNFTRTINSAGTHLDEIRVMPKEALMTSYAYDTFDRVISSTDPNNITTYYEYDGLGRLILIRDDDYNIIKRFEYNYASPQ